MTTGEATRNPIYGILSGPSGGVAGALYVARKAGFDDILTFDMGGTSTDVALCQNGEPTIGRETSISHFRIKVPSVNVHTVGAGGGSIAHVPELTKALRVGPQSAGADPGPASYGRGGAEPTVTDANVVLGHLPPSLLGGEMDARRRRGPRLGADDRRRDGPRLGRGGRRGDPRDRQREHGRRAAPRLRAARPRPARVRARRLRRRRAAPRERGGRDHGLVPRARAAGARAALRDRRPRGRLPGRVRADVHPRARRRRPGRGRLDPRGARRARPRVARRRGHPRGRPLDHVHRRHALPPAGLRDPGRDRPGRGAGRARRARGAVQRPPRAALRVPDARRRRAEIVNLRAIGSGAVPKPELPVGDARRRRRVGGGRRGARDRLQGRAARRRRSTTARSSRRATASTGLRS